MKLFTLNPDGTLATGIRLADFSELEGTRPNVLDGILVWNGKKRGLWRLSSSRPPDLHKDGLYFRVHLVEVGGWYPQQHVAPNEQPEWAEALYSGVATAQDTIVVAVAAEDANAGPKATVRRMPERSEETWVPMAPRTNRLLHAQETNFARNLDPVHLLYAGFGETFRFTWDDTRDWVVGTDDAGRVSSVSFTEYQKRLRAHYAAMDRELSGSLL